MQRSQWDQTHRVLLYRQVFFCSHFLQCMSFPFNHLLLPLLPLCFGKNKSSTLLLTVLIVASKSIQNELLFVPSLLAQLHTAYPAVLYLQVFAETRGWIGVCGIASLQLVLTTASAVAVIVIVVVVVVAGSIAWVTDKNIAGKGVTLRR